MNIRSITSAVVLTLAALEVGADSLPSAIRECMAAQLKSVPFSGVVAAGKADVRFWQSHGFADAKNTVSLSRDTPFRLASVGKVFTRIAVGTLMDAGKLRLDDPVRRYLPELPVAFAPITLAQLIEHRAGVAPMTRPDFADDQVMGAAKTARDLVAVVGAKPLSFAAGSQEQYSNGGYLLLGAVIEATSGKTYRAYVAQSIFDPLGMKSSGFEPDPGSAVPLTRLGPPGQPPLATPQPRMEFAAFKASSAGDAFSSAADLEALALALLDERLLKTPTKIAVFPRRAQPWRMGQLGGNVGSNTAFWVLPDERTWLIVLSNFDPPAGELMSQVLNEVLSGQPCKPTAPRERPR